MSSSPDIAVIGLGAMGSAVLYQLARRGVRAVGLDRFQPPHAWGSSHGETRITRQGVGEGTAYVPLVQASHRIWRELEAETGDDLLRACGALVMAPGSVQTSHHGKTDFVGASLASARAFDIPHEMLDAAGIARRFPHFTGLAGDEVAYHEPGGGYVRPERAIAAQLALAERLGAGIRTGTTVQAIHHDGGGVRVETDAGALSAEQAIVAAGPWVADLLGHPFADLMSVTRQVLHWFELDDPNAVPEDGPVFIRMHGAKDTDYLYGFPRLPGETSVKVATEQYASATTPGAMARDVTNAESAAMFRTHVAGRIAGVSGRVAKAGRLPVHRHAGPRLHRRPPPRDAPRAGGVGLFGARVQAFGRVGRGRGRVCGHGSEWGRPVALRAGPLRGRERRRRG